MRGSAGGYLVERLPREDFRRIDGVRGVRCPLSEAAREPISREPVQRPRRWRTSRRPGRPRPLGPTGLRVAGAPFAVRISRLGLAMVEEAAEGLQLGV